MKIESNYNSSTGNLDLVFDARVQKIFSRSSKKMELLFRREPSPVQKWLDEEADEDIGAPLRLLAFLASSSSRSTRVSPVALGRLLGLVCSAALLLKDRGQSVNPLGRALILLAKATPMLVLSAGLPPATEIWNRKTVSPAVRRSYESLRSYDRKSVPLLSVLWMHRLLQELRRLPRPSPSLKELVTTLDASTLLFRLTAEALDLTEVAPPGRRREKK